MAILDRLTGLASPATALHRAIQLSDSGKPAEAFPLMAKAARAGITEAEYRVARSYLEGSGVPPSRLEGARWLCRAAQHGSADAQAMLAALYVRGLVPAGASSKSAGSELLFERDSPGEPNFDAALHLATQAAQAGSATGQAVLGYILTHGPASMRNLKLAHQWYERSASAGCPEGCLGFALSLASRNTTRSERARIAQELRRAADAGLPTAIYLLAVLTEHGQGLARDVEAAKRLYQIAAERGLASAQFRLGLALINGELFDRDAPAGEAWLRRAALGGNIEAACLLGDRYAKSPNADFAEAATWYRRAAEGGHRSAARALATLYLTGSGVAKDGKEGVRWLRAAADSGDQEAQVDVANLLLNGDGEDGDGKSSFEWFVSAAEMGDAVAAFNVGLCFANGIGVRQNEKLAAEWFEYAADEVPEAQYMYARALQDGRGVAADPEEARLWLRRAADAGLLDAILALAEMLTNGRGGRHAPASAVQLFLTAAAQGHVGAMFALGALYSNGEGLPLDPAAARKWFAAAAESGHGEAQLMLGRYLIKGLGGERDPAAGRFWLERAAAQGVTEAGEELAECTSA